MVRENPNAAAEVLMVVTIFNRDRSHLLNMMVLTNGAKSITPCNKALTREQSVALDAAARACENVSRILSPYEAQEGGGT